MMDETNSKEERNSALNALWVLSFTANNKDAILNEKGCIDSEFDFTRVRFCLTVEQENWALGSVLI